MRFTRRLRDWRGATALVLVSFVTSMASCSSDDDAPASVTSNDASVDGSDTEASAGDASVEASPSRDAGPYDAATLPVVCSAKPCALSLVTTLGANDDDRSEGFCARLDDGTVACWGANGAGQLGRGDEASIEDDPTPQKVVGLSHVVSLDHTCAIDDVGSVHCWGTGPFLRDDAGFATTERTPVTLPIPPAKKIGIGSTTGCAATADNVVCWGRNDNGQVAPFGDASRFDALGPRQIPLPTGASMASIAGLVVDRASFVIGDDGVVSSWGANPPLARASSLSPDPYPLAIALEGVTSLDIARDNACATAGGIGYCWGAVVPKYQDPESAPLLLRALPAPVVSPEPLTRIATTRNLVIDNLGTRIVQPQRWCAVGQSGAVFCAGYNGSGQAGDGTKNYAYEAAKVIGLPGPAADVKATPDATCALLTSGKVYCWGSDFYGQLGTGEIKVPSLVPQEVRLP